MVNHQVGEEIVNNNDRLSREKTAAGKLAKKNGRESSPAIANIAATNPNLLINSDLVVPPASGSNSASNRLNIRPGTNQDILDRLEKNHNETSDFQTILLEQMNKVKDGQELMIAQAASYGNVFEELKKTQREDMNALNLTLERYNNSIQTVLTARPQQVERVSVRDAPFSEEQLALGLSVFGIDLNVSLEVENIHGETLSIMRHKFRKSAINEFGSLCVTDLFSEREIATSTVEPDMRKKRGNKKALDQDTINLIKIAYIRYMKGDVIAFKALWDSSIQESLRQKCRDAKRDALLAGHKDWFTE